MNLQILKEFESEIQKEIPGFKVSFKNESKLQKLIGYFVKPFNSGYMNRFTSTFYPTVWFVSKEMYEGNPRASFITLAHEFVHLYDTKKNKIWFRLSYLLPQILSLVFFMLYIILNGLSSWPLLALFGIFLIGCFFLIRISNFAFVTTMIVSVSFLSFYSIIINGWYSIPLILGLILLAPWPSYWRVQWELRGYGMSLAVVQWIIA